MFDAPAGRRERTKAVNRAAILVAARDVFGEVGFGAATVRDIVGRAGLAAGTFYNYFPDKEAVFRALVDAIGAEGRRRVRAARRAATSLDAFVEDAFRAYFSYIVEKPANQAFVSRNAGTVRALFDGGQIPLGTEELIEDLEAAIAAGTIPPLDVTYMAHTMLAISLELGEHLLERDPPDVEGATRFAAGMVLGGVAQLSRG